MRCGSRRSRRCGNAPSANGRSCSASAPSVRARGGRGAASHVCPLCQETALEHGWIKEGTPTQPTVAGERRRQRRGLGELLGLCRARTGETIAPPEPILRRLSDEEMAVLEAADLFNASTYRRTVGGIAKSLGEAQASIIPLSGVSRRARRHRRVGPLLVPVPGHPRVGSAGAARAPRPRARRARGGLQGLEHAGRGRRSPRARHRPHLAGGLVAASPQLERHDLLRHTPRARRRAVRQDGRVLQGQPERDASSSSGARARTGAAASRRVSSRRSARSATGAARAVTVPDPPRHRRALVSN